MLRLKRTILQLQLFLILLAQVNFLRALQTNSSDMQSLLDEFANSENATDFFHPNVDNIFGSSADNSSNELVIKKNLYIFPINAPNLVIAQKHEIHAVPVENATNSTDEEPVTELHEIHEISLSRLLPVNDTQNENLENEMYLQGDFNDTQPENFEIVSGYKPGAGLITKQIPLPQTVNESITLPQKSIGELLSSLNESAKEAENQTTAFPDMTKREINETKPSELRTEFFSMLSQRAPDSLINDEAIDDSKLATKKEIEEDDLDVAEDIVFRPLFRYRQETRLRPQVDDSPYRSSYRRRDRYRDNYDNYYPRYRYRPRSRSDNDDYYN